MKTRISVATLLCAAIALPIAANNWNHIDAYLTNHVGAPDPSETSELTVPTDAALVRLAVAGDVGTGDVNAYRTGAVMDTLDEQHAYDALLLLGDNIYDNGDPNNIQDRVLYPFGSVLDGDTTLLAVLGNHDIRNDNGPAQAAALGMPNEWYSHTIADTTIIALDSNQADLPEQRRWLEGQLAETSTRWIIVMMHHSAYSAGWHGNNATVIEKFVPLFEQFDVDLVLSGHDHDYQRTKPINDVTYVVTGAAAKTRPAGTNGDTAISWSTHSFVDITIYDDRIEIQAVDHDGRVIDTHTL